jgi:O-antigen/teichoic acid export membrane protein
MIGGIDRGPSMPRRTAILLIGRIASAGTTLLVLAVVGRLRGDAELGAVGVGLAIGAIAAALSDLGAIALLVREASQRPERAGPLLVGLAIFRLPVLVVALLGAWAVAQAIDLQLANTIALVAAGIVVQSFAELPRAVFMARQRFTIAAAHFVVENVAWFAVVVGLLVVYPNLSMPVIFLAGLAVMVTSILAGFALVVWFGRVALELPTLAELRALASHAPPFAAFAVLGVTYTRIDTVIIGLLLPGGLAAAGSYFAATRLIAAFEYVPESASRGVFPEIARRFISAPNEVAPLLGRVARGLLLVGGAIPAALLVSGDALLKDLFDSPAASAWVLGPLSIVVPIRYLGHLYGIALTSAHSQGRRVAASSVALVVVVAGNLIGIPAYGLGGSVVSAIVAAVVVGSMYAFFVRRLFGAIGIGPALLLSVGLMSGAAALVGLVVRVVSPAPFDALLGALAAIAAYAAMIGIGPGRPIAKSLLRRAG